MTPRHRSSPLVPEETATACLAADRVRLYGDGRSHFLGGLCHRSGAARLQGNLGLLLPTMALVIGVIALVTINYHQLSGWLAGDGSLLVRGAQTPVAAGERPGCCCRGFHTRDEPAAWMAVDFAWSSSRDRRRVVPAVGAGRMPSGSRLGSSTG